MDKADSRLHYEQIEKLYAAGKYRDAVYLVDKVDWRKTEENKKLILAAEVYRKNRRFDDAINILKMAHTRKPNNKKIVFLLCEIYFENKDVVTAQVYLDRYQSMTDKSDWHYDALKYKRALAYNLPVTEKIDILLDIKAKEPAAEQFRYELASMYQQARQYAECGAEVDELLILFGDDGKFAKKALEIKKSCMALTDEQESLLRRLSLGRDEEQPTQNVKLMNTMDMSALNLESALAKDIQTLKSEDDHGAKPRKRPEFHTKSLEQTIPPSTQEVFFADKTEDIHFTEELSLSGYTVKPNGDADIREVLAPRKPVDEVSSFDDDEPELSPGRATTEELLSDWQTIKARNTQNLKDSIHKGVVEQTGEIFKKKKESKYYGSVTGEIPGSIWKEVDLGDEFDDDLKALTEDDEENDVDIASESEDDVRLNADTSIIVNLGEGRATGIIGPEEIEQKLSEMGSDEIGEGIVNEMEENEDTEETEIEQEIAQEAEYVEEQPEAEEDNTDGAYAASEDGYDEEPDAEEEIAKESEETDDDTQEDEEAPEEEPVKAQGLSPEEKKLFAPFLYSKQMRDQIAEALDNISMASYVGNVIITTDNKESGFNLAKSIVKFVKFADTNFSGAMSRISADKFNDKNPIEILDKLNNGALVIDKANELSNGSLIKLTQGINQEDRGIIIFLVDTRKEIKKLLTRQRTLSDFFNVRIDIIAMNEDALVDYGTKYANNLGYSIEEGFASLAFHKVVREAQAGNHIVTVAEVKEIVDNAIAKNKKGSIAKLFRNMSGKNQDENGMILLREKDFQ